jgi:integration host factor subunit beta
MIKSELILCIAEQNRHLYEREVEAVVNTILERISGALVAGNRVELRGLGTFSLRARGARQGRNPKTGAAVPIAEKKTVAFKPGKGMQARLNPSQAPANPELKATLLKLSRHA